MNVNNKKERVGGINVNVVVVVVVWEGGRETATSECVLPRLVKANIPSVSKIVPVTHKKIKERSTIRTVRH